MLKKKLIGIIYFSVSLIFIYCFAGYFIIEEAPAEYENNISKMKYQINFEDVYFPYESIVNHTEVNAETAEEEKIVYLTFDDGPSARTEEILDILDRYNIKATFFVVYNDSDKAKKTIQRAYNSGHTLGIHSTSHSYKENTILLLLRTEPLHQ